MSRLAVHQRRRGTSAIEFAITCPIVFFLVFATIVGGLGVFRYQQVAAAAREGARWASVHGADYADETGNDAATPADIFASAILPASVTLDPSQLSYTVTWDKSNQPLEVIENFEKPVGNTVTVTVTYQWIPEMYIAGPVTLSSTSTAQMVY